MSPLRALQASCWLAFLGLILLGGHAGTYIASWQHGLVMGSLLVLALGLVIGLVAGRGHRHDGHDHDDHGHASSSWIETGVHALPLLIFLGVGPTSLGSQALGVSGMPTSMPFAQAPPTVPTLVDGYARTDLLALRHDPFLDGGKVEILARLGELAEQTTRKHRTGPAPTPRPILFRYVISCCAADGQPVYAWLKDPPPVGLALDTWVRVRGSLDVRETGGVIPVISADTIEVVDPPLEVYLVLPGATKKHR